MISGRIINSENNEPVPFANIILTGTNEGTTTDENGTFNLSTELSGYFSLSISSIGYKIKTTSEYFITSDKPVYIELKLEPSVSYLDEVEITNSVFDKNPYAPLSSQKIGVRQIEKSPGGNRDISKVIQSLPGVSFSSSFRNDIIIRGGAPSENRFYLDGIEVPVINHFQTQGASGGPVGIINVDFIREVDFFSGSFPAEKQAGLSSLLEFRQREGNHEKQNFRIAVGSSDMAISAEGPIGDKTSYIASIRRSYLQFLFKALNLPFLPTFNDFQIRTKTRFDNRNELIITGIGAIDDFILNESVNDDITDQERIELNNYLLNNIPENSQWSYAIGTVYKHQSDNHLHKFILSRNALKNNSEKFSENKKDEPENLILDYSSEETENKFRYEISSLKGKVMYKAGVNFNTTELSTYSLSYISSSDGSERLIYESGTEFRSYGGFASATGNFGRQRFSWSLGFRADGSDYSEKMSNPLKQFSPRATLSYSLSPKFDINAGFGIYYQLPPFTSMNYADSTGILVNKETLQYISNNQLTAGISFFPDRQSRINLEGFYKKYDNYPFSLTDSISLANLGSDFGVVGNDIFDTRSEGRAYGVEISAKRRSVSGIFGIVTYTFVRSEFNGRSKSFIASSWDNRHIITTTLGKKLSRNWDAGIRWRFLSGRPYTPYDIEESSIKENWDVRGEGIPDFDKLNQLRLSAFHQLDIRIDKSWYFDKWSVQLYLDIQNVYNFESEEPQILNVVTDDDGNRVTDPNDSTRYQMYFIDNNSGSILPSIGFIIDF